MSCPCPSLLPSANYVEKVSCRCPATTRGQHLRRRALNMHVRRSDHTSGCCFCWKNRPQRVREKNDWDYGGCGERHASLKCACNFNTLPRAKRGAACGVRSARCGALAPPDLPQILHCGRGHVGTRAVARKSGRCRKGQRGCVRLRASGCSVGVGFLVLPVPRCARR